MTYIYIVVTNFWNHAEVEFNQPAEPNLYDRINNVG